MRVVLLVLSALVLLFAHTASAQIKCQNITLYTDDTFDIIYTDGVSAPYVDKDDRLCGALSIDTSSAPYPCYNITITKITICSGTHQDLLPYDPDDPANTGCHTSITDGILRKNILYDANNPNATLASYNPNTEILGPNVEANLAKFCFDVHKLTDFNYVIEADWVYEAIMCPILNGYSYQEAIGTFDIGNSCLGSSAAVGESSSTTSSDDHSCPDPPPEGCGCDCIEGSTRMWDECGECHLRLVDGVVPIVSRFLDFQPSVFPGNNSANPNGHPDFQYSLATDVGIPNPLMDPDEYGIIVYGNHPFGTTTTHSAALFTQWWLHLPYVNTPIVKQLNWTLVPNTTDTYTYLSLIHI